jgi:hypothetical protein
MANSTDQALFDQVQYALLEPVNNGASYESQVWTLAEVVEYANQRQNRFISETGAFVGRATLNSVANQFRHALPQDWSRTVRVTWEQADGTRTALTRADGFEFDHGRPGWTIETRNRPLSYSDSEGPQPQLQVMPRSFDAGLIILTYVADADALDGSGRLLTVPDEFLPAIKWGVLSDMLRKVSRLQDPARADYAESRFEHWVAATKLLLTGWL